MKGGGQFKAIPAGPDIFALRKSRTDFLKVIMFVFRPKSSEEQKKFFHALRMSFIRLSPFLYSAKVLSICLRGGGGRRPQRFSPSGYAPTVGD